MSKVSYRSRSPTNLWYPSLIIPLFSSIGKQLFSTSFHVAYDRLNLHFEPQEDFSYCGIACASTLLNTLRPTEKWNQSNIFSTIARAHMSNGIILSKLSYILEMCGLSSIIRYCEDETIEEQFRKDLKEDKSFIIVNYWRQFQVKDKDYIYRGEHFSLIGGFNEKSDDVLILDTSDQKFPHHWISLKYLLRMMCTYDRMSSMPRGYLIVMHPNDQFKFPNQNQNLVITPAEDIF